MPVATVISKTVHKDLKSCPGGWVELKQLTYDQMLERRDNATRMYMEAQQGKSNVDSRVSLQIANKWSVSYDFRNCIVDHNLETENGTKLDFSNQLVFQILDPKIGAEIEKYIDEMNQELEEDTEPFFSPATSSSTDKPDTPSPKEDTDSK